MRLKSSFIFILALVFSLQVLPSFAQEEALPLDLQKKFEKGLAAAEQNSWKIAIKYFKEILDNNPFYFPAYFNMALAHEKAGDELAAIAYFKGYLHHGAAAEDRAQVEKEITRLEVAVEAKIEKIMKQAEEAAFALPEKTEIATEEGITYESKTRLEALHSICYYYADMLDEEGANKFAQKHLAGDTYYTPARIREMIANNLISKGDVERGLEIALKLPPDLRDKPLCNAAKKIYKGGDLPRAVKILADLKEIEGSNYDLEEMFKELIEKGQSDTALKLFEKVKYKETKYDLLPPIAGALAAAGQKDEANALIKKFEAYAGDDRSEKIKYAIKCAEAYEAAGEPAPARAIIDGLDFSKFSDRVSLQAKVAFLYAKLGDLKKADAVQNAITDADWKGHVANDIIRALIDQGKFAEAEKYLPYVYPSPFGPFSLGWQFAQFGWYYLSHNDSEGFSRIEEMVARKKVDGYRFSQSSAFYKELAVLACRNGNKEIAAEYIQKISDKWVREAGVCTEADFETQAGRPDEALGLLLAERSQWKGSEREEWIVESGLNACDKILEKGPSPRVKEFIDAAAGFAEEEKLFDQFGRIGKVYDKLGEKDRAARFTAFDKDKSWLELAREFAAGETADPDAYFQKAKDEKPEKIPDFIARLAVVYAEGMRKLAATEKALAPGKK